MPSLVRNRRDLARHLQAQMVAARTAWPGAGEEEGAEPQGRYSVKSYLIEAHHPPTDRSTPELLREVAAPLGASVVETDEPDLFSLQEGEIEFWCDTSFDRYWRLHTVAQVDRADRFRDQLVGATPYLDNVWLPPTYLEGLPSRTGGVMQTFSLSHDRRLLHDSRTEAADFDSVSMRLWASAAATLLQKMRHYHLLPHGVSIRSVKLRSGADEPDADFCVAEYFHDGKVTVNGTSFDEHNRVLLGVLRDYGEMVARFERTYAIGWAEEDGCAHLAGQPITIEMEWTVSDLEYAVRRMFSATEPFRLWGLPQRVGPDHYRARAVDLHVGRTLTFDITRRHIIIRLPRGTCGNTIVRFLGSLHYHVNADAGTTLLGGNGSGETPGTPQRRPGTSV